MTSTPQFIRLLGMVAAGCVAAASCSKSPTSASTNSGQSKRELLAVWRAADTPIDQRLSVARSLLPTNMHTDEVEALLGPPTTRHRHNPGMPADAPTGTEHPRIHWWYDYQFKDGTVVVRFLQVMNVGRFEAELQSVGPGGTVRVIPLTQSLERTNR